MPKKFDIAARGMTAAKLARALLVHQLGLESDHAYNSDEEQYLLMQQISANGWCAGRKQAVL